MKKLFCSAFVSVSLLFSAQKNDQPTSKMEWFQDAKLGIFIHWGIYSVKGISESWAFFNNYINHDNYMKQLDGFTASNYQPETWAELIKNSGAKYSVITTRHHDGVSLWDSKADKAITTLRDSKAKKDVLTPFVVALKKTGLKTGLYYSLPDWSHDNYDVATRTKKRYDITKKPQRWNNFVKYYQDQLNELSQQYQPDLIWFDGDWEHTSEDWKAPQTLTNLRKFNKDIIINSRLNQHGDYATPEQGVPVVAPDDDYWELCYTMNDSWGYQPFDTHYKTPNMIVRTLTDVISMGGNLLIDIGPKADGTIVKEQLDVLENLGRWTKKYPEAIYGTRRGLDSKNYLGKSAFSKDGKKLFLYLDRNKEHLSLHGLQTEVFSLKMLNDNAAKLNFKTDKKGNLDFDITNANYDKDVSVIELSFKEKPKFVEPTLESNFDFNQIINSKNTKQAVYQLAEEVSKTKNVGLFQKYGFTEDGQNMNVKTQNSEIKNWLSKHAEAFYNTGDSLPSGHFDGLTTLSKDRQTLYLFVDGKPNGPIAIKGLKNQISRVRIIGEGSVINHQVFNKLYWSKIPGIVYIDIPEDRLDNNLTIIAVLLDKPVELFRENISVVDSNL